MKEFEISRLIANTWHSAFMAGYKHGYKDCMKNHEKPKNMFICEMNPCGIDVCPYVLGAGNVLSCEECELNDELQKCESCNHYKLTCDLFSEICKYEPKKELHHSGEVTEMVEPQMNELQFAKQCHKPQSLEYRCYCDEREEDEYCNGCKFWYEPTVDMFALDMAIAKCKAQHNNCIGCDKKCVFRNGINNE